MLCTYSTLYVPVSPLHHSKSAVKNWQVLQNLVWFNEMWLPILNRLPIWNCAPSAYSHKVANIHINMSHLSKSTNLTANSTSNRLRLTDTMVHSKINKGRKQVPFYNFIYLPFWSHLLAPPSLRIFSRISQHQLETELHPDVAWAQLTVSQA